MRKLMYVLLWLVQAVALMAAGAWLILWLMLPYNMKDFSEDHVQWQIECRQDSCTWQILRYPKPTHKGKWMFISGPTIYRVATKHGHAKN